MKRILIALVLFLNACAPAQIAPAPPVMAEPAVEVIAPCPTDDIARDDGIGGTGCR